MAWAWRARQGKDGAKTMKKQVTKSHAIFDWSNPEKNDECGGRTYLKGRIFH